MDGADAQGPTFTKVSAGGAYGYRWRSPRWACNTCGRSGITDPGDAARRDQWFTACQRGHSPCVWCGRQLTLRKDGTPRVHARCPGRPDSTELLRLLAAEIRADVRLAVRGPATATGEALLARLIHDQPGGV